MHSNMDFRRRAMSAVLNSFSKHPFRNQSLIAIEISSPTTPLFTTHDAHAALPNQTAKPTYASLLQPTTPQPSVSFSQLPPTYSKGDLFAVKIEESVYQQSIKNCQNNEIGRFILPKGSQPLKVNDLHRQN